MKTIANCVNNRSVMKNDRSLSKEALEDQYGDGYFTRVYRTSLIALAVMAMLVGGRLGMAGLIGLVYGAAASLGGLRVFELVVPALFRPGVQLKPRWVVALMILKLPLLSAVLAGAAWLAVRGYANPFTLVGGLALTQAVMFLKAVGALLVSALPAEPARSVAPWLQSQTWRVRGVASSELRVERRPKPELSPSGLSTLN